MLIQVLAEVPILLAIFLLAWPLLIVPVLGFYRGFISSFIAQQETTKEEKTP